MWESKVTQAQSPRQDKPKEEHTGHRGKQPNIREFEFDAS